MRIGPAVLRIIPAAALLAVIAACGGSSSSSPAAPSATTAAVTAGAGATGTATILGVVSSPVPGMTVVAVGSASSAAVDPTTGQFQLNSVPSGDVSLRFSAAGVNATATVPQVAEQQHVELAVSVSGSTCTITKDVRGGPDSSAEVEGAVSAVAGTCPALTLTVGAVTVTTTSQTTFSGGACSDVKAGVSVDAKGTKQSDGSVAAQSIRVDTEPGGGTAVTRDVEGTVSTIDMAGNSFVVSGQAIRVTAQTRITHGSTMLGFADIKVGYRVHVKGTADASGAIVAAQVDVQNDNPTPPTADGEVSGTVSGAATGSCPSVRFSVKGTVVSTGPMTTYAGGTCGDIKVGATVDVRGLVQPDKSIAASWVKIDKNNGR